MAGGVRQHRRNVIRGNKGYFLGSFAFAWLAQSNGTANCNVTSTGDGSVRSIETERGICGPGETTSGSPQDGWADPGRANELDGSECERYVSSWWQQCGQAQEAPGADDGRFGFGAFAARYQPENFSGEHTGWRDSSRVFRTWVGRFQPGRVQEIIRSVEARPGDEAIVTELDLRLDD